MLNTHEGVRSVDPRHIEVSWALCLTQWQRIRLVILPAAMPSIVTGIRLALIYAWLATIGAEYFFASGLVSEPA
jgi:sulfonate transport system permease protein